MSTTFDPVTNLAYAVLDGGITSVATTFNVVSGGSLFPNPAIDGAFDVTIWNITDYSAAHLDPNAEIMRVTTRSANAFTVTRAQQSTSAVAHNSTGKTYAIALTFTKKGYDEITAAINLRGELAGTQSWTGVNSFDQLRARTSSGVLIEASNGTDVALFGAGNSNGATFYGGVNITGTLQVTQLVQLQTTLSYVGTDTVDGSDNKVIFLNGAGGGHSPTRAGYIYCVGNEYASEGGDVTLVAGDSAISGSIKFYVHNGGFTQVGLMDRATGSFTLGSVAGTGVRAFYAGAGSFSDTIRLSGSSSVPTLSNDAYVFRTSTGGLVLAGQGSANDFTVINSAGNNVWRVATGSLSTRFYGAIEPSSSDLCALGSTSRMWSDAFLASGGVINWNNGDATITHSTGNLTFSSTLTITTAKQIVSSGSSYNYLDINNASGNAILSSRGSIFLDVDSDATSTANVLYVRFNSTNYTSIFEEDGALTLGTVAKTGSYGLYAGSGNFTGKIQIGTTAPSFSAGSALTINSSVTTGSAGSGSLMIQGDANKERIVMVSSSSPLINMFACRGTIASPTATQNGDLLSGVSGGGYGATGWSGNKYVYLQYATENWTDSAQGLYTAFYSVPNGSTALTARLLINQDGAITLGSVFSTGTGALYAGAGTFTSLLTTVASASGRAGLRIPHGTAPSSPVNGDLWTTTSGMFVRINGITKTVTLT